MLNEAQIAQLLIAARKPCASISSLATLPSLALLLDRRDVVYWYAARAIEYVASQQQPREPSPLDVMMAELDGGPWRTQAETSSAHCVENLSLASDLRADRVATPNGLRKSACLDAPIR